MVKSRWLITGIITGVLLSFATASLAEGYKYIRAVMDNSVILSIDGEVKNDDEVNVLIYEDRIYLPLRFLSEELGADIEWDDALRKVEVNTSNTTQTEEVEEIPNNNGNNESTDIDSENSNTSINDHMYSNLPITKYASQALVQVRELSESDGVTVVSVEINNQGEAPMQLDQQNSKLVVENKEYRIDDLGNQVLYRYDNAWFTDVYEEEKREGIIRFPKISNDAQYAELHLKVLQNDGSGKEYNLVYHIKLK